MGEDRGQHRRRVIVWIVVTAWVGITAAGVGLALMVHWAGDIGCEAEVGDSNFGELEWSAVPPGPRCVWTPERNGFAAEDGPSPAWSLWLLTVVGLGLAGWRQGLLARRDPAEV